ncbi:MAG: ribonuclease P protein component [Gemmatimonadetes bacterium]|nr:ribonuclease P protein component [Gemmatimonadota bacterium]
MSDGRPFPRASRLRRSSDIRSVFRTGRRQRCGPLDIFLGTGQKAIPRVAIVVPRHGRTAVERNRLKRRLREIIRLFWLPVAPHGDLVVRARPDAYERDYAELRDRLMACLEIPTC